MRGKLQRDYLYALASRNGRQDDATRNELSGMPSVEPDRAEVSGPADLFTQTLADAGHLPEGSVS